MKKIYSFGILLLLAFTSNGQLTLTKAVNAPTVGTKEMTSNYDSSIAIPKSIGLNRNWDFTSLQPVGGSSSHTYVSTSSTPSASAFPSATIATDDGANGYNYYNSQNTSFQWVGGVDISGGSDYELIFSNPMTEMVWPFTYGTSNSDTFSGVETYSTTTNIYTGNTNISGTGTGTVTLPNGQKFTNCLQITRTYTYIVSGSFTGTLTGREYEYWTSSFRTPIINVDYITFNTSTITSSDCQISVNSIANVGIEENELDNSSLVVYPNPSKDVINVQLYENAIAEKIELFDVTGKLVLSRTNSNSLNTSSIAKGIYLLKVSSENSTIQKQVIITE